jgi:hypothetical protein
MHALSKYGTNSESGAVYLMWRKIPVKGSEVTSTCCDRHDLESLALRYDIRREYGWWGVV